MPNSFAAMATRFRDALLSPSKRAPHRTQEVLQNQFLLRAAYVLSHSGSKRMGVTILYRSIHIDVPGDFWSGTAIIPVALYPFNARHVPIELLCCVPQVGLPSIPNT